MTATVPQQLRRTISQKQGNGLTLTDAFCGAGGSDQGAEQVPGVVTTYAINHWQTALDTHNENMPHVDHIRADLSRKHKGHKIPGVPDGFDPRSIASTDLGWFSPECTPWSLARGKKVDYDAKAAQPSLWEERDEEEDDEEKDEEESVERSRFQMETVVAFVRIHHYRAFIVENVPAILKWWELPRWIRELVNEGYDYKIVHLNSAFAAKLGAPAPQLRDRVYFVFWRSVYSRPDFNRWLRPRAWCPACERDVDALYVAKPGPLRPMHYGERRQYQYRCPSHSCRNAVVWPYTLPAVSAIDLSIPAERIGDRNRPLKPHTLERIKRGLPLYAQPMVVPVEGRDNVNARPVSRPMRAQTARLQDALVVPLRNNTTARRAVDGLLPTFAASGQHHALVMRNQNSRGGNMCTPLSEPIRTITASCLQSLIRWDHLLFPYDARSGLRTLDRPLPTQTTIEGDALLGTAIAVEDCTFRMLDVHEIKAGSAFPAGFRMTLGSRRDRVRMLGNAVTPNAARDLIAALVEAITGVELGAA